MVESTPRRRRTAPRVSRDAFLVGLGAVLTINEFVIRETIRPSALPVLMALMGVVPYLQKGDRERDKRIEQKAAAGGG